MSSVSQTPAAPASVLSRFRPWIWLAIAAILLIVLAPVWRQVLQAAAQAHPHGPDLALFARLPLAIKLHILGAVSAIAVGAALMTLRKGRTFHRTAGWLWVGLVSLVAGSSLFITSLNHGHWSLLHLLTGWTLIILPVAVLAARRHKVAQHRRTMMGLFYGGFALNAFIAFIPGRVMWTLFMG
ncbi:DUF2306 domain-containing protein [Phenylobacterium aquaticum]|uniref:DUF2306 domain-containing protein n=1 Tax=Phenylobacterium aquaticum TaxID=1763816 RepID=UPI0026EC893E|nr:DUF2306 domain-containing protein [Phenylobacterium aquaticum]